MVAAQRFGVQLPRARCIGRVQKTHDLAREAVNCNAGLGRPIRGAIALLVCLYGFSMNNTLIC